MPNTWKDEQISRELKKMSQTPAEDALFARVLFKIETRLENRKKHFWNSITWKPWAHPGGWAALAACLCVSVTGAFYHQNQVDNNDLDSYLIFISNPTVNTTSDSDGIKMPILLTEEIPTQSTDILLSD